MERAARPACCEPPLWNRKIVIASVGTAGGPVRSRGTLASRPSSTASCCTAPTRCSFPLSASSSTSGTVWNVTISRGGGLARRRPLLCSERIVSGRLGTSTVAITCTAQPASALTTRKLLKIEMLRGCIYAPAGMCLASAGRRRRSYRERAATQGTPRICVNVRR